MTNPPAEIRVLERCRRTLLARALLLSCVASASGACSDNESAQTEQPNAGSAGAGTSAGAGGMTASAGSGGSVAGTGNAGAGGSGAGSGGSAPAGAGGASGAPSPTAGVAGTDPGSAGSGALAGAGGTGGLGGSSTGGQNGSAGSAAGSSGSAGAAGGTTPVEEALPELLSVRQEHAVVALRGEIYVIGGYTPNATASVDAYDPVEGSWRSAAPLPEALQHANVGVIGDKLYLAGFYPGGAMSAASGEVFVYDPDADAWTPEGTMPSGSERATACTTVYEDKLYLFGGARNGMTVAQASAYDPTARSWTPLPDMPVAREHCVAGVIGDKIYIAGGRRGGITGVEPSTLEFDPAAPGYLQKAPIPTPRGGLGGAVLRGRLVLFGGEGNDEATSGVFPHVDAYDPASDTWEALPAMQVPRHGFAAAALDDRIYLPGGATRLGAGAVNDASVFFYE